ncbi:MAG: hypothetical protein WAK31_19015 [Chthoniobacterales bacterium]
MPGANGKPYEALRAEGERPLVAKYIIHFAKGVTYFVAIDEASPKAPPLDQLAALHHRRETRDAEEEMVRDFIRGRIAGDAGPRPQG